MELKPGYKQTEVGVIPEEWEAAPLKGKVNISHGFPFASEHFASHGPYRLATPGHFYEAGGFRDIGEKQKYYVGPVHSEYVLQPRDVIVAMTEQSDGLLGSAAVIPEEYGYLHNQRLGRVTVLLSEIQLDYLVYVFNSPSYRTKVRETAAGTKVKHTSPEKLLEISVRLPPLPEQRAIAAALSDVDGLLGGLDRLIAKKRDLKQAAMQQLLTGQTRLPGFDGEWEVKTLGSLLHKGRLGGNYANQDEEAELPLMKMGNLARGYFDLSKVQFITPGSVPEVTHRLVSGDVLFNTRNTLDLVGKVAIWRDELPVAYYNSNLMRLEFDPEQVCSNQYANYALNTDSAVSGLRGLATGTTSVAAIYTRDLMKLQIIVPPLPEQTAIAEVLTEMDAELAALAQRREKTRALKQAMMQELLTGRTRLQGSPADLGNGHATAQEAHA